MIADDGRPPVAVGTTTLTFDVPKTWWLSANDRLHWAPKGQRTRHLRSLARMTAQREKLGPHGTCHVAAFIGYLRGGKADPANSAPTVKALIDGLVDAGVWTDDDSTHVIGPTYLRDPKSPTPDHYRVRLVLTEQEGPVVISRALQIALYVWNKGIERAREEYVTHPTACATWCVDCVQPPGTTRDCPRCQMTQSMRRSRRRAKESR